MTSNRLRKEISALIIYGELDELIRLVFGLANNLKNKSISNNLILLSSQFRSWERKYNLGLTNDWSEKNRLALALLEVIEEIELDDESMLMFLNSIETPLERVRTFKNRNLKETGIVVSSSIVMTFLLISLGFNIVFIITIFIILLYWIINSGESIEFEV